MVTSINLYFTSTLVVLVKTSNKQENVNLCFDESFSPQLLTTPPSGLEWNVSRPIL